MSDLRLVPTLLVFFPNVTDQPFCTCDKRNTEFNKNLVCWIKNWAELTMSGLLVTQAYLLMSYLSYRARAVFSYLGVFWLICVLALSRHQLKKRILYELIPFTGSTSVRECILIDLFSVVLLWGSAEKKKSDCSRPLNFFLSLLKWSCSSVGKRVKKL